MRLDTKSFFLYNILLLTGCSSNTAIPGSLYSMKEETRQEIRRACFKNPEAFGYPMSRSSYFASIRLGLRPSPSPGEFCEKASRNLTK